MVSVIIPTYNRIVSLLSVLDSLKSQSYTNFEVIVIDDWSTDWTLASLTSYKSNYKFRYYTQANQKQGIARNNWASKCSWDLILFLQDDIVPWLNLLQIHSEFHHKHPQNNYVWLWNTKWSKTLADDPFHKFLDWSWKSIFPSPLFDYRNLTPWKQTDFYHFYTNNLSIKTKFFLTHQFSDKFNGYWWEDIELGYRLSQDQMQLIFLSDAIAYHNHKYTISDFVNRERTVQKHLSTLFLLCPLIKKPNKFKIFILKILSNKVFLYLYKKINLNLYWYFTWKNAKYW